VATGDGDTRARFERVGRKIHERGGDFTDIDRMDPTLSHALLKRAGQLWTAEPAVTSDHHRGDAASVCPRSQSQTELSCKISIERSGDDATNVVGFECGVGKVRRGRHGRGSRIKNHFTHIIADLTGMFPVRPRCDWR